MKPSAKINHLTCGCCIAKTQSSNTKTCSRRKAKLDIKKEIKNYESTTRKSKKNL